MVLFYSNLSIILFEFIRLFEASIPKALAPRKSAAGGKLGGNCLVGVVNAWCISETRGLLIKWARSTKDVKPRSSFTHPAPSTHPRGPGLRRRGPIGTTVSLP
jgi:hypothetical protein